MKPQNRQHKYLVLRKKNRRMQEQANSHYLEVVETHQQQLKISLAGKQFQM